MFSRARNQAEQQILQSYHLSIIEGFQFLINTLEEQFRQATEFLSMDAHRRKYICNIDFFQSVTQSIDRVKRLIDVIGDEFETEGGIVKNIYLINQQKIDDSIRRLREDTKPQIYNFQEEINSNELYNKIHLSKEQINENTVKILSESRENIFQLKLYSEEADQKNQIEDRDLLALSILSNISILSLKNSAISDTSLELIREKLSNLRQIDLSGCYMITERGIKIISECELVTVRLNSMRCLKESSVLTLIVNALNLNFLELRDCPHLQQSFFLNTYHIYQQNSTVLKWLQITSDFGLDLFINKLTYLTETNPIQQITDNQFETLIGSNPLSYTGIFFNNCQQLSKNSVDMLIQKCCELKRLAVPKFYNLTDKLVKDIALSLTNLALLDFTECHNITDNSLYYIATYSNISFLTLDRCSSITDRGMIGLLTKQQVNNTGEKKCLGNCLRYLSLSNCRKLTDQSITLMSLNLQQLIYLNLSYCDQITDSSINILSQTLLKLQYINLNYCDRLTDSSISMLATRLGKTLKAIQIQWCQISQSCIRLIVENLTNLKSANFSYCTPAVCSEEIEMISRNIPKLQSLKLQSCSKINQIAFIKVSSLRQLRTLSIKQCTQANDTFIKLITTNSKNIQHLDLSWCSKITDNSLLSISKNCYFLKYLNLNGCIDVTDNGIKWLSATISPIQYLNFNLCGKLTDRGILDITNKFKKLKSLHLCKLNKITDISISSISNLENLEQLCLLGCTEITSSSVVGLLYNLEKLQQINISGCRSVLGNELRKTCKFMKNIKILEISEIQVDDQFIDELVQNCGKLTQINLCYCKQISDKGVMKLLQNLPRLERLEIQNTKVSQKVQGVLVQKIKSRKLAHVIIQ